MNIISAEGDTLVASLGIFILGNLLKPKNRDVGNMVQGMGIGVAIGTIGHLSPLGHIEYLPHHDLIALAGIPIIFILDKTNTIQNKDLANNLYGIGIGALAQHLTMEGCSLCGVTFCKRGERLC